MSNSINFQEILSHEIKAHLFLNNQLFNIFDEYFEEKIIDIVKNDFPINRRLSNPSEFYHSLSYGSGLSTFNNRIYDTINWKADYLFESDELIEIVCSPSHAGIQAILNYLVEVEKINIKINYSIIHSNKIESGILSGSQPKLVVLTLPQAINILENYNINRTYKSLMFLPPTETRIIGTDNSRELTPKDNYGVFYARLQFNSGSLFQHEHLVHKNVISKSAILVEKDTVSNFEIVESSARNTYLHLLSTHARLTEQILGKKLLKDRLIVNNRYFTNNILLYNSDYFYHRENELASLKMYIRKAWGLLKYNDEIRKKIINIMVNDENYMTKYFDSVINCNAIKEKIVVDIRK